MDFLFFCLLLLLFWSFYFFYNSFLFEEGKKKEREREKDIWKWNQTFGQRWTLIEKEDEHSKRQRSYDWFHFFYLFSFFFKKMERNNDGKKER